MKTILYDHHVALGAKIVTFAGWEMPLQYKGILEEHRNVRSGVGLFDVSHMGKINITGPDSERFLDFVSVNLIKGKPRGTATYTVLSNEQGGCIDDVIIYKVDKNEFFMIVNAGNRERDLSHLTQIAKQHLFDVEIEENFSQTGIIALQGPFANKLLASFLPGINSLKPMQFFSSDSVFIARCGYTGSGGYELYGPSDQIIAWWEKLLNNGQTLHIQPVGLGARDSLRLEAGFALYGHELSDTILPNESVAAWTIKWEKQSFLGKEALEKLEKGGSKRHAYGIRFVEGGVPRQGYSISKNGKIIGEVTSGGFSPELNKGIALILVNEELKPQDILMVQIRQTFYPAEVVELPFVRK